MVAKTVTVIICLLVGVVGGYGGAYTTYAPKLANSEALASDLTTQVSTLNQTVSVQMAQEAAQKERISSQETQISKQQSQISNLESSKSALESNLSEVKKTIAEHEIQATNLKSQISTLNSQVSGVNYQKTNLQTQIDKLLAITVTQNYEWTYLASPWTWSLPIPLKLYVEYQQRPRPNSTASYVDLAKDPKDDLYIDRMVQQINIAATKAGFTESAKINFVVAFVQSLPYTVDKETTPSDEYPRYPIETLFDNGGDCEDTSILVAALLDRMGYDVALLHLSGAKHMAVGISLPGSYGTYYDFSGKKYYYLETTSNNWKIGQFPTTITDKRAYVYPLR